MTQEQLNTISTNQEDYFNGIINTTDEGIEIKRNQYQQVLLSEGLGYWVDILQNQNGWGYVVNEERVVNGVTERKATGFGQEAEQRTHDWYEILDSI